MTFIPNTAPPALKPEQAAEPTTMEELIKVAQAEAAKQSTNPIVALADRGIHRSPEDVLEDELKAAGWKPASLHPRSPKWFSPDGVLVPGPGYAHFLMKQGKQQ